MPPSNLATAADYADAMMIARRAKNWLFLLLMLMVLAQIAIFFVARTTSYVLGGAAATPGDVSAPLPTTAPIATPTTAPTDAAPAAVAPPSKLLVSSLQYVTALIDFLGIALVLVLASVLLLITK